ncbi:hypothetical protein BWI15_20780 [Kribbella sp. ALI-6-A]|uniref:NAD(P)H-binding protein n=1 Tax=Kribbella sp. ALI-6-A TaxID=1933817 RepID=UPI00097BB847|nr:NAD(P)H-binding protein [Kribbella sp. ALI-6-A]ONI69078.1 hypothetical protein BWI15_20780 [Kribbella sp. ALI-6-A]
MITITTPTGQIGRTVVDRLLGVAELRLLARDPDRLPAAVRAKAEVVQGSHEDPDVLAEACSGAESVFWLVPPNAQAADLDEYYLTFARAAATAFRTTGVRRVVNVSTLGRGIAHDAGHLTAALAADDVIAATGVDQRTLCAPYFLENFLNATAFIAEHGMFTLPMDGDRPLRTIATADIAAVAAELLLDDSWSGRRDVPVIGPDELTLDQMAEVMSEVLGRPVRFQPADAEQYKAALTAHGVSAASADGLIAMARAQNEQRVYDSAQRVPRSATTCFAEWCEQVLKPAVAAYERDRAGSAG